MLPVVTDPLKETTQCNKPLAGISCPVSWSKMTRMMPVRSTIVAFVVAAVHLLPFVREKHLANGWSLSSCFHKQPRPPTALFAIPKSVTPKRELRVIEIEKWDNAYKRLVKYKEEFGDTHVRQSFSDGQKPPLGGWVSTQRQAYKNGSLTQERLDKLKAIGFKLELTEEDISRANRDDSQWNSAFQRLIKYKEKFGDANVPNHFNDGQIPHLGIWVNVQRREHRIYLKTNSFYPCSLSPERIDKLNSVSFLWGDIQKLQYDQGWMYNFNKLKEFQHKYRSTKVYRLGTDIDDSIAMLATWTQAQQTQYSRLMANKTSTLTLEQIKLLNSIEFSWSNEKKTGHEKWLFQYFKLYSHHHQNNNTVITDSDAHNSRFVNWVSHQKVAYHTNELDQPKVDLMNELDFDWELDPEPSWDDYYAQLCQYHVKYNSTLLNKIVNSNLAKWCNEQRKMYNKELLLRDQISKLNSLDFDWYPGDVDWNAMYDRLLAFARKHDSVLVPFSCAEDPPLGNWVRSQRKQYSKLLEKYENIDESLIQSVAEAKATKRVSAEVHADRLRKLVDIDFVWDTIEAQWLVMFERLVKFKLDTNSTLVPDLFEDTQLLDWVRRQRKFKLAGKLEEHKIHQLDEIDFVWDPLEVRWDEMFVRLSFYQQENGNCNVPCGYGADPELASWVRHQRSGYKRQTITTERISRLESIGFVWSCYNDVRIDSRR